MSSLHQLSSTGEEALALAVRCYDDLSRLLWGLEGLPLTVSAVQGAHPVLRYTEVRCKRAGSPFWLMHTPHPPQPPVSGLSLPVKVTVLISFIGIPSSSSATCLFLLQPPPRAGLTVAPAG